MIHFADSVMLVLLLVAVVLLYINKGGSSGLERIFSKSVLEKVRVKNQGLSAKVRNWLLIGSFIFGVIALARPWVDNGEIKVKSSFINIVAGFDISQSMFANDIYPSRFALAKRKFNTFLQDFKNAKVALIGFSSRAFLIAPLTQDYNSLKFLTKNLGLEYLNLRGTSVLSALEAANNLFEDNKKKVLVLFTDGGDKKSYEKEISYAKEHHISVFVYAIGTKKGGVIKTKNGVLKDQKGDIVVVKLNPAIKELALKSGGAYLEYSLKHNDIKALCDAIKSKFKAQQEEESIIKDKQELFYYPLGVAILLLFAGLFSFPRRSIS